MSADPRLPWQKQAVTDARVGAHRQSGKTGMVLRQDLLDLVEAGLVEQEIADEILSAYLARVNGEA